MCAGTTEKLHRNKKKTEFLKINSTKMILKCKQSMKSENESIILTFWYPKDREWLTWPIDFKLNLQQATEGN